MSKPPDRYVRPKRRPLPRERVTIARLLGSIFVCAIALSLMPFTRMHEGELVWGIMLVLFGLAVVIAKYGGEGAALAFLFGTLLLLGLGLLLVIIFGR